MPPVHTPPVVETPGAPGTPTRMSEIRARALAHEEDILSRTMATPDDAAIILGVEPRTALRWIEEGRLARWRFSPRILRVLRSDVFAAREHVLDWLKAEAAERDLAVSLDREVWFVAPLGGECSTAVYVAHAIGTAAYKIGIARNATKRLADLQVASPVLLELVLTFPGDRGAERAIHQHFKEERLRGEWFEKSGRLLAWIERQRHVGRA